MGRRKISPEATRVLCGSSPITLMGVQRLADARGVPNPVAIPRGFSETGFLVWSCLLHTAHLQGEGCLAPRECCTVRGSSEICGPGAWGGLITASFTDEETDKLRRCLHFMLLLLREYDFSPEIVDFLYNFQRLFPPYGYHKILAILLMLCKAPLSPSYTHQFVPPTASPPYGPSPLPSPHWYPPVCPLLSVSLLLFCYIHQCIEFFRFCIQVISQFLSFCLNLFS